jgi:hypothetical protein
LIKIKALISLTESTGHRRCKPPKWAHRYDLCWATRVTRTSVDEGDQILAKFPGPVTLYVSRKKWLLMLAGCVAFTGGSVGSIPTEPLWGWGGALFFGAGTILSIVMLLPGAGMLTLDVNGFEVTNLFRRRRSRWVDVMNFVPEAVPFSPKKLLGYNDANQKGKVMGELNVSLTGRNSALPDNYGLALEDLARLLTRWRERACNTTVAPGRPNGAHPPPASEIGY